MLQDLDATLKRVLLKAHTEVPGLLDIQDVRFAPPDDKFLPDGLLVNLFLLDVGENRELRDVRPVRERVGDMILARPAPLRVDCTYLLTAWSNETGEAKSIHEHRLLGEAMLWLSRFPTIPAELLEGALKGSMYPPALSVDEAREDRRSGQFWSALRISPRPAFFLTATISMDVDRVLDETRQVADVVLRTGMRAEQDETLIEPGELHTIGGRVLGSAQGEGSEPEPQSGAQVRLEPVGLAATTNAEGQFVLGPLREGTYRLRVQATGFSDAERRVQVPLAGSDASYDVILTRS
jgi:hypothetical protein